MSGDDPLHVKSLQVKYEDVFRLAQHRCPRIMHEEYRCPECEKVFSCPANLASHRRWHKPKDLLEVFECAKCSMSFETKKSLRVHNVQCSSRTSPAQSLSSLLQLNLVIHLDQLFFTCIAR
ncbi:unnamed protein product [Anisakis simplex]|uniref:C2H2 zinc finger protein EGL-46 (inferred by orthology to a C. elegans protein) n=1 Tax=Anisakis simplex TaxID=6269 RepID=A0A0M3KGA7_ANISI|nr:unnamed protein product [Anisakis simplex]